MEIQKIIKKVRETGKIDRGVNEVTKAVERNVALAVVIATNAEPKELTQHLPIICKEKKIPCIEIDSKEDLGILSGIERPTAAIAILEAGEADLTSLK